MPLRFFDCPDGERRPIEDCLTHCPRPEGRCLSLPTLVSISQQREWTGKPSTTQLINGTRLAYLQITEDYAIDPFDRAFALLGTRHHARLEKVTQKLNALGEEQLGGSITGILDLLVEDELTEGEAYELWDYKTSGSYKVVKCLGLVGRKAPSGETYQKTGRWGNAGDPKTATIWEPKANAVDMWEWEYQFNHYRTKVELLGFPVSKMFAQVTVRDGGTITATSRGITQSIYKIPIRHIPDEVITEYFQRKFVALQDALVSQTMPPPCDPDESWNGRRCRGFCDVAEFCKAAIHPTADITKGCPAIDMPWLKESLEKLSWPDVGKYLKEHYKVSGTKVSERVLKLTQEQADEFVKEVKRRLEDN